MMDDETVSNMIQKVVPKELSILGRWEFIIADEDKKPSRGSFSILKIKEIPIPPNSIVILLNVLKHYNAEVVDLLISDRGSEINAAVLYSETGKAIKRGEILGVVKISDTSPKERNKAVEIFKEFNKKLAELENGMGNSFIKSQWPIL